MIVIGPQLQQQARGRPEQRQYQQYHAAQAEEATPHSRAESLQLYLSIRSYSVGRVTPSNSAACETLPDTCDSACSTAWRSAWVRTILRFKNANWPVLSLKPR